jgi:hypothetical protein
MLVFNLKTSLGESNPGQHDVTKMAWFGVRVTASRLVAS